MAVNINRRQTTFTNGFGAFIFTAILVSLVYIITIPKEQRSEDVGEVKVALITWGGIVIGFFFGSSLGSVKNAETIRNLVSPQDGTTEIKTKSPDPEILKKDDTDDIPDGRGAKAG